MTDFQKDILAGIPDVLPAKKEYDKSANHAPKRKDILTDEEKKLALANALRYFPEKHHAELAPEFLDELKRYGRIYMYRLRPDYEMYARPIDEYPARSRQAAAIMLMIQNNLDKAVAQHPHELITYGGNGAVFQNWAQYRLAMKYLAEMTDEQTLVMYSGHPLGLFPSHKDAPCSSFCGDEQSGAVCISRRKRVPRSEEKILFPVAVENLCFAEKKCLIRSKCNFAFDIHCQTAVPLVFKNDTAGIRTADTAFAVTGCNIIFPEIFPAAERVVAVKSVKRIDTYSGKRAGEQQAFVRRFQPYLIKSAQRIREKLQSEKTVFQSHLPVGKLNFGNCGGKNRRSCQQQKKSELFHHDKCLMLNFSAIS